MSKSTIPLFLVVMLLAGAVPTFAQTVASKQDETRLIATLKAPDASQKDKMDACRQLAIIGGKDSIAPLAALLGDEKLSHMARYALEPNPDPAVNEALRDALGKVKGGPLVGVIGSLGVRRDAQAVPSLAKLLTDSDAVVARAAARALGSIGNARAAGALQKALPKTAAGNRLDVCEGLLRCAERLGTGRRQKAALAIYDQLYTADVPHQVRGGALRSAILARGTDGVALLKEHLHNKDYILFSAAVQAAQMMPAGEVTKLLTDEMKSLPADNQVLVIQTLGRRGDKGAVPALLATAQSGPKPVRIAAVRAATELGDASAVPALVQLLDDGDRETAQAARDSLAAFPGKEADAAVMDMFQSGNTARQLTALDLMGRRRMTGSAATLLQAARAGDPQVRSAAVKALGDLGSPEQVPALLDLLKDSQSEPQRAAVEQALVAVCTKAENPPVGQLVGRFEQAEPAQQVILLRVLGAVGGADALQAVCGALRNSEAAVRSAAIRALCTWKTADAAPPLLALVQEASDSAEQTIALRGYLSLAGRGDLPVEQRLEMCRQAAGKVQRDDEKRLLLGTLGNIGAPETLAVIAPYLDNAGTQQEAALATLKVAEGLIRGRNVPAERAARVIEPLEKLAQAGVNEDVTARARTLLRQARAKAGRN
jgi:HEAT repeat protein